MSRSPFTRLRPPRVPAELRDRVLTACREAAAAEGSERLLDRLWRSHWARRAWLVCVAVLILGNLAVLRSQTVRGGARISSPSTPAELWEEVGLPRRWQPRTRHATWADRGLADDWSNLEIE